MTIFGTTAAIQDVRIAGNKMYTASASNVSSKTMAITFAYDDSKAIDNLVFEDNYVEAKLPSNFMTFGELTNCIVRNNEFNVEHDGTAKLGDLNVSKIAARGLGCTQTGTPYYASPEVWKDNPYNLKSDIWSLGCLCYEILMLKTPFRAETMEGLFRKVMKGKYPEISKKYSNKFDYVISWMLQLKPEERPTTEDILKLPEIVDKIEELKIYPHMYQKKYMAK